MTTRTFTKGFSFRDVCKIDQYLSDVCKVRSATMRGFAYALSICTLVCGITYDVQAAGEGLSVYESKDKKSSMRIGGTFEFMPGGTAQSNFFSSPDQFINTFSNSGQDGEAILKKFIKFIKSSGDGAQFKNYNGFAMDNSLYIRLARKEGEIEYGLFGEFGINPSPSSDGSLKTGKSGFIYVEGKGGKVMVGPYSGPGDTMRFSAANIARGTGGIVGAWSDWVPYVTVGKVSYNSDGQEYLFPALLNDAYVIPATLISASDFTTKGNKLMYYTPRVNGIMFGVGYTPSLASKGTNNGIRASSGMTFENLVEFGVNYVYEHSSDLTIETSLVAEFAPAAGSKAITPYEDFDSGRKFNLKRYPLAGFEIGGIVQYRGWSVGAGYGYYGKSGAVKDLSMHDKGAANGAVSDVAIMTLGSSQIRAISTTWNAGITYDAEKVSGSVGFAQARRAGSPVATMFASTIVDPSERYKALNSLYMVNIFSVSLEYRPVAGVRTYAELSKLFTSAPVEKAVETNSPLVALAGLQVTF